MRSPRRRFCLFENSLAFGFPYLKEHLFLSFPLRAFLPELLSLIAAGTTLSASVDSLFRFRLTFSFWWCFSPGFLCRLRLPAGDFLFEQAAFQRYTPTFLPFLKWFFSGWLSRCVPLGGLAYLARFHLPFGSRISLPRLSPLFPELRLMPFQRRFSASLVESCPIDTYRSRYFFLGIFFLGRFFLLVLRQSRSFCRATQRLGQTWPPTALPVCLMVFHSFPSLLYSPFSRSCGVVSTPCLERRPTDFLEHLALDFWAPSFFIPHDSLSSHSSFQPENFFATFSRCGPGELLEQTYR